MDKETKEQHACSNASASNSLPLFTMKRHRGKYWQFIKLVAPSHEIREWESKDAVSAWCELCRVKISYAKGNIELDFGNYLNEKHFVESNQDPFEWWRVNRTVYPKLALSA